MFYTVIKIYFDIYFDIFDYSYLYSDINLTEITIFSKFPISIMLDFFNQYFDSYFGCY